MNSFDEFLLKISVTANGALKNNNAFKDILVHKINRVMT